MKAEGEALELHLAAVKVPRYADRESGDTLEVIERPHGGFSAVLVDGQHTGRGAKAISNLVARKAVSLLADGVRDGAAARAASDYLYAYRKGRASATLNLISADLASRTLVVSRNGRCPVVVWRQGQIALLDAEASPVGLSASTRPHITEVRLEAATVVVMFTDGVWTAGERYGDRLDVAAHIDRLLSEDGLDAGRLAEGVLHEALRRDKGRPNDDMSLAALSVLPAAAEGPAIRRLTMRFPVWGVEGRGS